MNSSRPSRARASERGEGYARLIIFLVVLLAVAYMGFQNLPTYFAVQSFKHELAELIRGLGTLNQPVERVQPQVNKLATSYGIAPADVKLEKSGKVLKATLNTNKKIDLIVTTYDWQISEEYIQSAY